MPVRLPAIEDAKSQTKLLRTFLNRLKLDLSDFQAREAVAQLHGFEEWRDLALQIPDDNKLFLVLAYSEDTGDKEEACFDASILVKTTTPELALYHARHILSSDCSEFAEISSLKIDSIHCVKEIPTDCILLNVTRHVGSFVNVSSYFPHVLPEEHLQYELDEDISIQSTITQNDRPPKQNRVPYGLLPFPERKARILEVLEMNNQKQE